MSAASEPAEAGERAATALLARVLPAARHGFFVLVRLLERLRPDAVRVGGGGPPRDEAIRFRHDHALVFHPGDVARVELAPPAPIEDPYEAIAVTADVVEVTTTFLGLSGTVSPMPTHLAEEVAREDPDGAVQGPFLDLFHHRLLSLLYRLVAKYDLPGEFMAGGADDWSRRVLALAGIDVEAHAPALPRWQLLRLAPLLATRARDGETLRRALIDVLGGELGGAAIEVEEMVGAWVAIEGDQRCRLGRAGCTLGRDLLLGQRVFDRAGKFGVHIGPLARAAFDRLRPGGDLHARLRDVVGLVNADPLAYQLELVLGIDQTPPLCLSVRAERAARLGHSAWLGQRRDAAARIAFELEG